MVRLELVVVEAEDGPHQDFGRLVERVSINPFVWAIEVTAGGTYAHAGGLMTPNRKANITCNMTRV